MILFLMLAAWTLPFYYALTNLIYVFLLYHSIRATKEHHRLLLSLRSDTTLKTPLCPPISILVPARNEEASIVEVVNSMLALDYPEIEVIVVNDGSTDGTLTKLQEHFALVRTDLVHVSEIPTGEVKAVYVSRKDKRILVLDKKSCGRKADAVNAALNAASSPFVCVLDGDAILERDALRRIMAPTLNDPERVIATGGIVRAANGCTIRHGRVVRVGLPREIIPGMQVLEYLRSFLLGRQGWARLDMLLIISGAFGVFRRDVCRAIGGFRAAAIGEDMDLIVRMHRFARRSVGAYRVAFVPDPVCWTEVPTTTRALGSQRSRWQNGLADLLIHNWDITLNPAYGRIGMIAIPYQWLFELLAPLFEVFGWAAMVVAALIGRLDSQYLAILLATGYLFGVFLSVGAVVIEEMVYRRYERWSELLRLVGYCFLEPLFYRPLNTMWRIRGLWYYATGQNAWQLLPRTGLSQAARS
jgi:cellulose synthase/poly-beta-1,6-N-acetylglucosamine synthase-like glycosyltransferase